MTDRPIKVIKAKDRSTLSQEAGYVSVRSQQKALDPVRSETALLEILIARNPERAKQFLRRLREAVVT